MQPLKTAPKKGTAAPDYRMLLTRLEGALVRGKDMERCRKILREPRIWPELSPEDGLKWGQLAQMAGETDAALLIYAHLNERHPEMDAAWAERIELLTLLGREAEASGVRKAAPGLKEKSGPAQKTRPKGASPDPDGDAPSSAFDALRSREAAISRYMRLFSGREDCFARQWADQNREKGGYVPVRRPMTPADAEAHLSGRATYGIYLIRADERTRIGVIDADLVSGFRKPRLKAAESRQVMRDREYMIQRIEEISREMGLFPLVEFSGGKGFHFWYFFDPPASAGRAKEILAAVSARVAKDLSAFSLEVFPKQAHLSGKGLGNLVKLPLGIHRGTGKPSRFIESASRHPSDQLEFLKKVKTADPGKIGTVPGSENTGEVCTHPRFQQADEEELPQDLAVLRARCPPLGKVIAACCGGSEIALREEKVLFQTLAFLPDGRTLLHRLMRHLTDYNIHLTDYKAGRVRGKPLGCRRIHSLLEYGGDHCRFEGKFADYPHPLLHIEGWKAEAGAKAEKVENLSAALENLKSAILLVERFLK